MTFVGLHPDQAELLARSLRRVRDQADHLAHDLQLALQLSGLDAPTVVSGLVDVGAASSRASWSLTNKSQLLRNHHLGLRPFSSATPAHRPPAVRRTTASSRGSLNRRGRYVAPHNPFEDAPKGGDYLWSKNDQLHKPLPELTSKLETTSGKWDTGVDAQISRTSNGEVGAITRGSETWAEGPVNVVGSGELLAGARFAATGKATADLKNRRLSAGGSISGFAGAEAAGTVTMTSGPVEAAVGGRLAAGLAGEVGGSAVVDLKKGELRAKGGVEAQLALTASVDATVGLGDSVTAAAEAEAMLGLAVVAHGELDISLKEISASWEVGGALGVGASFNIDVSFSPEGVIDDIGDIGEFISDIDLGEISQKVDFNPFDGGFDINPFG